MCLHTLFSDKKIHKEPVYAASILNGGFLLTFNQIIQGFYTVNEKVFGL
jgi:hypothetical protein